MENLNIAFGSVTLVASAFGIGVSCASIYYWDKYYNTPKDNEQKEVSMSMLIVSCILLVFLTIIFIFAIVIIAKNVSAKQKGMGIGVVESGVGRSAEVLSNSGNTYQQPVVRAQPLSQPQDGIELQNFARPESITDYASTLPTGGLASNGALVQPPNRVGTGGLAQVSYNDIAGNL